MDISLKGRTALVCGAGSVSEGWGNGKATAVALARAGAYVVAVDINLTAAQETAALIVAEGGECLAVQADATNSSSVENAVCAALAKFGSIDILQNVVGTTVMGGPVELSEEQWQKAIDINLKSAFLTCKHVLPVMVRQGRGVITNTSSLASIRYVGYPYTSYYAAKGGLNQLTQAVALQYAKQGVRCNAVMPGVMNTPLIFDQISSQYESKEEMIRARDAVCPMGRMGTAWDIAHASVFLASDLAQYITGVVLPVDGGISCRSM
ncbi:SDR family oxidoreductase [Paraburkholderia dipogonis]|uniref:SDR family oxidoreductase n=1 Tax=Paraburkholderia dipogonis TaxID=1211383 RepID=A0A4Y8MK66_9BURK|nr:SDR family NAD(P)-dependent oxidoreductase [Paraburkholderia dipogonis]TFE37829.1 SDR family oxidoreductase [Paraburkholderia dipogonis]